MRTIAYRLLTAMLFVAAFSSGYLGESSLTPHATLLFGLGVLLLANDLLCATYYKSGTPWPQTSTEPQPLRISWLDYVKAAISWTDAFKRTYTVEPGLYYTGNRYDPTAPLLVTCNYRLTIFLLLRRLRARPVRMLVIDTDGINVWCAAGKGVFGNEAILTQLDRYDRTLLTEGKWLTLLLPKFAMAGVDLRGLRREHVRPIIGPLYAKDLPAYLDNPPLRDCSDARVVFGLQMRCFSWLPGFKQMFGWSLLLVMIFMAAHWLWGSSVPVGLFAISLFIATAYPFLFPYLPGDGFAPKGLFLGAATTAGLIVAATLGLLPAASLPASALFALATALLFSLSYTGNSAVSNYTKVRKETARFFVPDLALYAASLVAFVVMEL
jgi:acetyl-CoA decarbonylase/synthase complex subunit gamma